MAKKVFKLKIDSLFISKITHLYFFATGLSVVLAEAVAFYSLSPFLLLLIIPMFAAIKYLLKPAIDELKVNGPSLVTVDTDKKYIQLDNNEKMFFSSIRYIFVKRFANSQISSSSMADSVASILSANSDLFFNLKDKESVTINVQRKDTYRNLLILLKQCEDITLKLDDGIKLPKGKSNKDSSVFFMILMIVALAFVYWAYFLY